MKPKVYSTTPAASQPAIVVILAVMLFAIYYRLSWPFLILVIYLSYLIWNYWWAFVSSKSTTITEEPFCQNIFAGESFNCEYKFLSSWILPLVRCGIRCYLPSLLTCTSDIPHSNLKHLESDYLTASDNHLPVFWDLHTVEYAWLPQQKISTVKLQIQAKLRGLYYLPPVHFFSGDPSGLYQGFKQAGEGKYLTVFPNLRSGSSYHKILAFEENSKEDIFGAEDRSQSIGIRDFQPNDPPKSINWYATARTNSIKTNLYQHKDTAFCLVAFDLAAANQPITEPDCERSEDPDLEEAISLVCEIALSHLEQGFSTAFLTNAPLLAWKKREQKRVTDIGALQIRTRKITALDFGGGTEQEQNILQLCSAIDDTARATFAEQETLWSFIQDAPANTVIYLLGYHTPPARWKGLYSENDFSPYDPASFYTSQRIATLASNQVRVLNLSGAGGKA